MAISLYDDVGNHLNSDQHRTRKKEMDKVDKLIRIFDLAHGQYRPIHSRMFKCQEVLADRPWNEKELKYFRDNNRDPDLAIVNVTKPHFKYLQGAMRSLRSEFVVTPYDDAQAQSDLVDVASDLLNWSAYRNRLSMLSTDWFSDGLSGIGNMHTYTDAGFIPNYRTGGVSRVPVVKIERTNPYNVYYDYDHIDRTLEDCGWVLRKHFFTRDALIKKYGERMRSIGFKPVDYERWWDELVDRLPWFRSEGGNVGGLFRTGGEHGHYCVLELEERVSAIYTIISDPRDMTFIAKTLDPKVASEMKSRGFITQEIEDDAIRVSTVLPYQYVDLGEEMLPFKRYSYTPYASGRDGRPLIDISSFVYSIYGLQKTVNLTNANLQEGLVKNLREGTYVDTDHDLMQMNKYGSKIGANIKIGSLDRLPVRRNNIDLKSLEYMLANTLQMIELTTGQGKQAYGQTEFSGQSGKHAEAKHAETQQSQFPDLDDFYHSLGALGMTMLEREQKILRPDQVIRKIEQDHTMKEAYPVKRDWVRELRNMDSWVEINDNVYATTQQKIEYSVFIDLFDRILAHYPPEIIDPSDIIEKSGINGAREMAEAVRARWKKIIEPVVEPNEEQLNNDIQSGLGDVPPA